MPGPYDFLDPQSPLPPPEPPIQQMAQARTKRIFGVPITPRRGRTFAAGLAQGLQGIQPGGGFNNFLAGFSGGLGGALRGGEVFDESQRRTHEDERQQIAQANQNRELQLSEERVRLAQNEDARQWGEYNAKMNPPPAATEDIGVVPYGATGPLGPGQIMAPQGVPKVGLEDYGKTLARKTAEAQFPDQSAASAEAVPNMDQATTDMLAYRYLIDGVTPMWARSKEGARTWSRVLSRAAHPPPEGFKGPNVALNTAQFGADKSALAAQQKLYDASTSWENTVDANAEVAMKLLPKIQDWGNQPMNWIARNIAAKMGSPEQAAFNTARETIKVEYARLLASAAGTGQAALSDTARLEVEKIMGGNQTAKQFVHSLNVLRQDAHNRRVAYGQKVSEIQGRIGMQPGQFPDLTQPQVGAPNGASQATDADRAYLRSLGIK